MIGLLRHPTKGARKIVYQWTHSIHLFAHNKRLLAQKFRIGEEYLALLNLPAPLMKELYVELERTQRKNKVSV